MSNTNPAIGETVTGVEEGTEEKSPFEDILIPTDGSDVVWDGIQSIRPITNMLQGTVHSLYVQPKGGIHRDKLRSEPMDEAEETVDAFNRKLSRSGLSTTTAVRSGVPAEEIHKYAEEHDIDLIVMVTHSDSPLDILKKSVTENVLNRSDRPLLAIHR